MFAVKNIRHSRLALSTTRGLADKERSLKKWQYENPYGSDYDPEFQELLRVYIGAYMIWMIYHPNYDDGYLDGLEKHLV